MFEQADFLGEKAVDKQQLVFLADFARRHIVCNTRSSSLSGIMTLYVLQRAWQHHSRGVDIIMIQGVCHIIMTLYVPKGRGTLSSSIIIIHLTPSNGQQNGGDDERRCAAAQILP